MAQEKYAFSYISKNTISPADSRASKVSQVEESCTVSIDGQYRSNMYVCNSSVYFETHAKRAICPPHNPFVAGSIVPMEFSPVSHILPVPSFLVTFMVLATVRFSTLSTFHQHALPYIHNCTGLEKVYMYIHCLYRSPSK